MVGGHYDLHPSLWVELVIRDKTRKHFPVHRRERDPPAQR